MSVSLKEYIDRNIQIRRDTLIYSIKHKKQITCGKGLQDAVPLNPHMQISRSVFLFYSSVGIILHDLQLIKSPYLC